MSAFVSTQRQIGLHVPARRRRCAMLISAKGGGASSLYKNGKVDEQTQRIFERMKPVRASPLFDAPQFCLDWIALAEKSGQIRDAQIMAWQMDKYSDGQPVRDKHGHPKRAWLPYHATDADWFATNPQAMAAYEAA